MRKKIKKAGVLKLSALFFAVAVAVCGVYGGALRSARAEEQTHKIYQNWRTGEKNPRMRVRYRKGYGGAQL